jgi:hypothetical protein
MNLPTKFICKKGLLSLLLRRGTSDSLGSSKAEQKEKEKKERSLKVVVHASLVKELRQKRPRKDK